ncbi:hypothetical protein L9F63_012280, partial [Diploptera punctata]
VIPVRLWKTKCSSDAPVEDPSSQSMLPAIPLLALFSTARSSASFRWIPSLSFSAVPCSAAWPLTPITYEKVCDETLDSLADYFEELIEKATHLKLADIHIAMSAHSDGVLTVQFGAPYGTYVINRQTPNLQIWLSSPTSGPKRYDFHEGRWVYRHDGVSLHELLNEEIPNIVKQNVDFFHCSYAKTIQDNK